MISLNNSEYENLLLSQKNALERFVYYKVSVKSDAEDILSEVFLTSYNKIDTLNHEDNFKAWILTIARNKIKNYYAKKAKSLELPLEEAVSYKLSYSPFEEIYFEDVEETLTNLKSSEKQILYLYYFKQYPQAEIAKMLNIPLGTVKSRLHSAKRNFKTDYMYRKGDSIMKKMPDIMPEYTITKIDEKTFNVRWEELMGWFLVPKLGEKLSWAQYDMPERKCVSVFDMEVTQKAEVHGIEGVELTARENHYSPKIGTINRTFVAQLTDTHCRYLATMRTENSTRKYITFLDEDEFMPNWGFGENNCGNEIELAQKGDIVRENDIVTSKNKRYMLDVVGRYEVKINGKSFDTVCVIDIENYNSNVVSEQYLDKNGRTILWRRFNRNDWKFSHYKEFWSDKLPQNEKITVNGETYVHWYDCITDYIL